MSLQEIPDKPLKTGFTTGACATAATKGALLALLTQTNISEVEIYLPAGQYAKFPLSQCHYNENEATCSVIKDAGDDPDVTHEAEISSTVAFNNTNEIHFLQGEGVGYVSMPGLEIPVGEPAINPVPRKMMHDAAQNILADYNIQKGVDITISVKNGAEIAKKTLNTRIGIINGISILGTSGIVTPFSASSYIASIRQGIDVAIQNNVEELVLNSGARSEKYLKDSFSHLPEWAFIHYGNWIGETLDKIAEVNRETLQIKKVTIGMMLGKTVKLAEGYFDTSSRKNSMNTGFLTDLTQAAGYPQSTMDQVGNLSMARHLQNLFDFSPQNSFFHLLAGKCMTQIRQKLPDNTELQFTLINQVGELITFTN